MIDGAPDAIIHKVAIYWHKVACCPASSRVAPFQEPQDEVADQGAR